MSEPAVPGMLYIADYLTDSDQRQLLAAVDAQPWRDDLKRRVQHYGYAYNYSRRRVDPGSAYLGPLPGWVAPVADRLCQDGLLQSRPDQVIVNEYLPGQGIAPHIDCVPCFGDAVISISLGSTCVMDMSLGSAKLPVFLDPGSLVRLSGDARYRWRHGIAKRKSDLHEGRVVERGRRVSLTFRTVIL